MAVSRFNAFSRLLRELADAKSALEERKVVERAKGILMKMRGLSEEDAFALLRQTAMNENKLRIGPSRDRGPKTAASYISCQMAIGLPIRT